MQIVTDACSYSGITPTGIKKTTARGDFKVEKYAGPCLNDGWRIVLISVPPRRTCVTRSLSSLGWGGTEGASENRPVITALVKQRKKRKRNKEAAHTQIN